MGASLVYLKEPNTDKQIETGSLGKVSFSAVGM